MTINNQRQRTTPFAREGGFALIGVLLLIILISAVAVAFLYATGNETKIGAGDREDSLAYYGAEAAMEKMMVDVGLVYTAHKVPKNTDFGAVPSTCPIAGVACILPNATLYPQPVISGITYSTYAISFPNGVDPTSNLLIPGVVDTVKSGSYQGLSAQTIPITLSVVSQRAGGAQVSMVRNVEVALIPVFQFGVFSETDLSYYPGPSFDFAGRVHTNGSLYLAEGGNSTAVLSFHDKITVVNQVIHSTLANGVNITGTRQGLVLIPSAAGGCDLTPPVVNTSTGCRNLNISGTTEESAHPNWKAISTGVKPGGYAGFIQAAGTGTTGAPPLKLPFVAAGVGAIEIIRRRTTADTQDVSDSRLYNQAQIRVLFDDADPASGLCVAPLLKSPDDHQTILLKDATANGTSTVITAAGVTTDRGPAPIPGTALATTRFGVADKSVDSNFLATGANPLNPGCLRVEYRTASGAYVGVTQEWLHLGFSRGTNAAGGSPDSEHLIKNTINPNAVLILQRDAANGKATPYNWYPINLYDSREGERGPGTNSGLAVGGIMNVVELDVGNLKNWLKGTTPNDFASLASSAYGTLPVPASISGTTVETTSQNGYILYFSDRRGMRLNSNAWAGTSSTCVSHSSDTILSGDYGYEDVVVANATLDTGEDSNENCHLDTYGAANLGTGFGIANNDPYLAVSSASLAGARSVSGARHALRLINGTLGNVPSVSTGVGGFTVASENPVYIQGNYNAKDMTAGCALVAPISPATQSDACWLDPGVVRSHAAVIADAVTLLSNAWNDDNDLANPGSAAARTTPTETYYRVAIAGGKSLTFPHFSAEEDYGTDGGVHNFLRFLENWGGSYVHYRGSLVSFYYSHQATGTFKSASEVYSPPIRDFDFDLDFKDPTKMPPGTPRFQDIVNIGYQQDFTPQ